jgi:hypothetical protein
MADGAAKAAPYSRALLLVLHPAPCTLHPAFFILHFYVRSQSGTHVFIAFLMSSRESFSAIARSTSAGSS